MRVGIDSRLPFYESGGISQYIQQLLKGLAKIDPVNEYLIFHSRKDSTTHSPTGISNFHRERLWTPCHHIFEKWLVGAEIIRHRVDLFHSPDFIPPKFGAKYKIITIHDLNFLYYPEFLDKASLRYYAGQITEAVQNSNHILADSHHTRQDIIDRLGVSESKVSTVHLAANPNYQIPPRSDEVEKTRLKYRLPSAYALFVGTISPRKNLPILFEALRILRLEAKIDLPLIIVGKGGWQSNEILGKIPSFGLEDRISHLDQVTGSELVHLYQQATVLLLPSLYEGFGLPPLEAMHIGCPVITSDRSSLPEVVGEAGITLDPRDAGSWSAALERVLTKDDFRNNLIHLGKMQAQKFNWEKTTSETLAIYEQVVGGG